jgi:hypothetical protein
MHTRVSPQTASKPRRGSDAHTRLQCFRATRRHVRQYDTGQLASGEETCRPHLPVRCESRRQAGPLQFHIIFVSVNAIALGRRTRTRDAIGAVRHVFLDADHDGLGLLSRIEARRDLPIPSYVLHSSPNHIHVFWRVIGFDIDVVERLQRQLARELQTDPAATPVTQNTRLPGFLNHKRALPHPVTVEYRDVDMTYGSEHFPPVKEPVARSQSVRPHEPSNFDVPAIERAKRYLTSVPPAIAGQHGDVHTFRLCCRLVRGFALDDEPPADGAARRADVGEARGRADWQAHQEAAGAAARRRDRHGRRQGRDEGARCATEGARGSAQGRRRPPPLLHPSMEERRNDGSDFLFTSQKGGKLDRTQFFRVFRSVAAAAGLP